MNLLGKLAEPSYLIINDTEELTIQQHIQF